MHISAPVYTGPVGLSPTKTPLHRHTYALESFAHIFMGTQAIHFILTRAFHTFFLLHTHSLLAPSISSHTVMLGLSQSSSLLHLLVPHDSLNHVVNYCPITLRLYHTLYHYVGGSRSCPSWAYTASRIPPHLLH
jgi:hypothetical protein